MESVEDGANLSLLRRPAPPPIPGRVVVVGACASGKSRLVAGLRPLGYDARSCAQEHSHVPDMCRRLSRPHFLIYLDASLQTVRRRRRVDYDEAYMAEQNRRLAYARAYCDLYIATDALTPEQVLQCVVEALSARGLLPLA